MKRKPNKKTDTKAELPPLTPEQAHRFYVKQLVRAFYDYQQLRIQAASRAENEHTITTATHAKHVAFEAETLATLERRTLREIERAIETHAIGPFLEGIRGIGPTLAGVIIAEIDISRSETVSQLWAYCGLKVVDGKAVRQRRGQKTGYNPWLKAKLLKVAGECMLKANTPKYRELYDNYKTRKQNTMLPVCEACSGTGRFMGDPESEGEAESGGEEKPKKGSKCSNCAGTGGPAPWGRSQAHRHAAAIRYMIKMFLADLFVEWRGTLGLPIPRPYAEAYLGVVHGAHAGVNDAAP